MAVVAGLPTQLRERPLATVTIATMDEHGGARLSELAREGAAEAVRRAGDQDGAVGERGQVAIPADGP